MKIVKQYDPRVKTTYVYEVLESHYDPSKKQTRSTRKLIGKLDSNGELIPTGTRGRPFGSTSAKKADPDPGMVQHYEELLRKKDEEMQRKDELIRTISNNLAKEEEALKQYKAAVKKIMQICSALPE